MFLFFLISFPVEFSLSVSNGICGPNTSIRIYQTSELFEPRFISFSYAYSISFSFHYFSLFICISVLLAPARFRSIFLSSSLLFVAEFEVAALKRHLFRFKYECVIMFICVNRHKMTHQLDVYTLYSVQGERINSINKITYFHIYFPFVTVFEHKVRHAIPSQATRPKRMQENY